jgi:hypothetical protein
MAKTAVATELEKLGVQISEFKDYRSWGGYSAEEILKNRGSFTGKVSSYGGDLTLAELPGFTFLLRQYDGVMKEELTFAKPGDVISISFVVPDFGTTIELEKAKLEDRQKAELGRRFFVEPNLLEEAGAKLTRHERIRSWGYCAERRVSYDGTISGVVALKGYRALQLKGLPGINFQIPGFVPDFGMLQEGESVCLSVHLEEKNLTIESIQRA